MVINLRRQAEIYLNFGKVTEHLEGIIFNKFQHA